MSQPESDAAAAASGAGTTLSNQLSELGWDNIPYNYPNNFQLSPQSPS